jgi:hypothetical protein
LPLSSSKADIHRYLVTGRVVRGSAPERRNRLRFEARVLTAACRSASAGYRFEDLGGDGLGVYIVQILGLGLGRTGAGLGRIPHVSRSSQRLQGLECSSSPTSGTCFPCSGACGPLSVYKSPLWAPAGAHFCWWPLRSGGSFSWPGQRCCCVLLHGRKRLERHDLVRLGDYRRVCVRPPNIPWLKSFSCRFAAASSTGVGGRG